MAGMSAKDHQKEDGFVESSAEPHGEPLASTTGLVEWMATNWPPLAAYTIVLVVAYWFEFRRAFALPVSFVSTATIGALPALGGMVLASVCLLAAFVLLPSVALWLPIGDGGRRLMDAHEADEEPFRLAFWRWRNVGRIWLAVQALFAIWVVGSLVALALLKSSRGVIQAVAVGVPVAAALLALHPTRVRAGMMRWEAVAFNGLLAWAMLVQSLVVINVLQVALGFIHGPSTASFLSGVIGVCFVIVAVTGQFVVAAFVRSGQKPSNGKWLVYGVLGLATLPLGAPDLGARLVAQPMRLGDPDGKACVVLLASSKAVPAEWVDISESPGQPQRSVALPFATLIEGYHVKPRLDGPTFTVPVEQVRGIDRCPSPEPVARASPPRRAPAIDAARADPANAAPTRVSWTWVTGDVVALGAAIVSLVSLMVAIGIQRHTYRPLISVRIRTHKAEEGGIALDIVIENTGSRPAMEISVRAEEVDIRAALAEPDTLLPGDVERTLLTAGVVPVLANGRQVTGGFGHTGTDGVWRAGASIRVTVRYQDVAGRRFAERARLHLADTTGFAQGHWSGPAETD